MAYINELANMKNKFSWRKLFNDIHLWLGIGSGLILFFVCLSGTIYAFRSEIEELLEPGKYHVDADENKEWLSAEVVMESVQQEVGGKVAYIEIPHDKDKPYKVNIKISEEDRRGTTYFVDPYTAAIKGTSEGPASAFFMFVFRLHRWLLLDTEVGRPIVGVATIIFTFLVLTGLVLWWPKKLRNWKQGFKIKTEANWKRINHDLHNTFGFYAFLLLLVMALTGLCWSFGWYREALSGVIGAEVFGGRNQERVASTPPGENASSLSVSEFIRLADKILPYQGGYRISLPDSPEASVTISKNRTGFFAVSASDKIQFDQYSGKPLDIEKFADKPLNVQIASTIKPLHTGEIFGLFSKILYFIACLIATSLPVTGTIIWINKLKKKSKKKSRLSSKVKMPHHST